MVAPAGFNGMLRIFAEQIDIWVQKWLDKNTVIENSSIQEDFPTVFFFMVFFYFPTISMLFNDSKDMSSYKQIICR